MDQPTESNIEIKGKVSNFVLYVFIRYTILPISFPCKWYYSEIILY